MISREKLLLAVASEIADCANVDRQKAMKAAKSAMNVFGLNVILPLLDVFEFDVRPLYRQRVIADVRDILCDNDPGKMPAIKENIDVRD